MLLGSLLLCLLCLSLLKALQTSPPNLTLHLLSSQEVIFGGHLLPWPHMMILYGFVSFHFLHVDVSCLGLFSSLTPIPNSLMLFYPQSCSYFYLDVTSNPLLSIKVNAEAFLLVKQDYKHQKVATQQKVINY